MSRRFWPGLAGILAFSACGPGGPPGPPGLAYGVPDPAAVTYLSGDTARVDIDAGGQSLQARMASESRLGVAFTRVAEGVQVSVTVEDLSARMSQPMGGPITADEGTVDGPLLFTMDRRGAVSRITEPEVKGNGRQFVQPLAMAHTMFPRLPGRGLDAGGSWTDTVRFSGTSAGSEVTSVTVYTYTVAGDTIVDGRSLVRIVSDGTSEQTSKGAIAGQDFEQSVSGDVDGVYLWDMSRGLLDRSQVDVDMRGTMTVAAAPFPLNIRIRGQSFMRLDGGGM